MLKCFITRISFFRLTNRYINGYLLSIPLLGVVQMNSSDLIIKIFWIVSLKIRYSAITDLNYNAYMMDDMIELSYKTDRGIKHLAVYRPSRFGGSLKLTKLFNMLKDKTKNIFI